MADQADEATATGEQPVPRFLVALLLPGEAISVQASWLSDDAGAATTRAVDMAKAHAGRDVGVFELRERVRAVPIVNRYRVQDWRR